MPEFNADNAVGVSVIIPLYNSERFIETTLNSVFNQTFQNYEVIVVDDCSTDRSVEIVENMSEKFGGKLVLIKQSKNSGGFPGVGRNVGIKAARGKYIQFLDNDDMLTAAALEELYAIAEETNAEVLRTDRRYAYRKHNNIKKMPVSVGKYCAGLTEPKREVDDIAVRLERFVGGMFKGHAPWKYFLRRDFIIDNRIEFPAVYLMEDNIFSVYCFCCAKVFFHIPNVYYIYRWRRDSASHEYSKIEIESDLHKYVKDCIKIIQVLDDFMNGREFFVKNPEWKVRIMKFILRRRRVFSAVKKLSPESAENFYDYFVEVFSNQSTEPSHVNLAAVAAYYFMIATELQTKLSDSAVSIKTLKAQVKVNRGLKTSTPSGAAVTVFNTFLTVDENASRLLHSNDPTHAIQLNVVDDQFAFYVPSLGKYIASFDKTGEITLQDDEIFLGTTVDNADGTISFRLNNKKYYVSPRSNGQCIWMHVNKNWEHFKIPSED